MNRINFVNQFIKKYKCSLVIYYFILIMYLCISFFLPISISKCIDECIGTNRVVNDSVMILSVLALFEFITKSLKEECNIRLSNKIAFDLEYDVSDWIMHADYVQAKKYDDVYLAQRINNDSVIIGDYVCEKLPYFLVDVVTIILITLYVFYVNITIGLLFMAFFALYFFILFVSKKGLYRLAEKMFDAQAKFFSMLSDQFNNVLLVKMNSWYREKNEEFKKTVKVFYNKSIAFLRLEFILKNTNELISRILLILVLIVLTNLVMKGKLTVGLMASFVLYIEILITKLNSFGVFGDSFQKFMLAKQRIWELKSFDKEQNGSLWISSIDSIKVQKVTYEVEHIKFCYPDISLSKNTVCIIKGENGSGKSTFINLLLGIIHPQEGMVYYNDIPINEINIEETRRKLISVKNQEPYIVEGTVEQNLTYGIESFSNNINTLLEDIIRFSGSRGGQQMWISPKKNELSGGEKQRLAISRSIYKNADLLIFDEPTNGLDVDAKQMLVKMIGSIRDKIIVIITHDDLFDNICDMTIKL